MIETLQQQLTKSFRADEHEWNGKGHIYVNVNATIQRLNELNDVGQPAFWSFTSSHFSSSVSPTVTKAGKAQYDSFVVGELRIADLGSRMGTGADTNMDLDTSAKSAQAYALRKAANQFGVAMYLLRNPKEEELLVKHLMNNDPDDNDAMKEAVVMLLGIRKLEVSATNIVKEFGVTLESLKNDKEVWLNILKSENRL